MYRTKSFFHRATLTLLVMLLTATTAWAQDFTVTYNIGFTGSLTSRQAFITRADKSSLTTTWDHSINVLWPANESHGVDDEFDITIKPNQELDAYSSNGNKLFKTEATTSFTITTDFTVYFSGGSITANSPVLALVVMTTCWAAS